VSCTCCCCIGRTGPHAYGRCSAVQAAHVILSTQAQTSVESAAVFSHKPTWMHHFACLPACHAQTGLAYQMPPALFLQAPVPVPTHHLHQDWALAGPAHKHRCSGGATQQESGQSLVNDVLRHASGITDH
jgi:hypothetical protein